MTEQLTLEEAIKEGERLAALAFLRAELKWKFCAENKIRMMETGAHFLAEDVVLAVKEEGYTTSNAKAIGAIIKEMAKLGYIRRTEEVRRAKTSHGAYKPVWIRC